MKKAGHVFRYIFWVFITSFNFKELSDEEKEFKELARKFTEDEIMPVAAHHDKTGEVCCEVHDYQSVNQLWFVFDSR